MSPVAYVVVVELGRRSWTLGPYQARAKAESVEAVVSAIKDTLSWIEPVYSDAKVVLDAIAKDD